MPPLDSNLITSRVSINERFLQLYRKLYPQFIFADTVHKTDYINELALMNERVTQVQVKLNQIIQQLNVYAGQMATHMHGNGNQGSPTTPPMYPTQLTLTPVVTNIVLHKEVASLERIADLAKWGPAQAPIAAGTSAEEIRANLEQAARQGP
jgi:hypothetical protein